jgi:hypothetical protein
MARPISDPRNNANHAPSRATATRYDKTVRNFLAAFHLVAAICWFN